MWILCNENYARFLCLNWMNLYHKTEFDVFFTPFILDLKTLYCSFWFSTWKSFVFIDLNYFDLSRSSQVNLIFFIHTSTRRVSWKNYTSSIAILFSNFFSQEWIRRFRIEINWSKDLTNSVEMDISLQIWYK